LYYSGLYLATTPRSGLAIQSSHSIHDQYHAQSSIAGLALPPVHQRTADRAARFRRPGLARPGDSRKPHGDHARLGGTATRQPGNAGTDAAITTAALSVRIAAYHRRRLLRGASAARGRRIDGTGCAVQRRDSADGLLPALGAGRPDRYREPPASAVRPADQLHGHGHRRLCTADVPVG